MRGIRRSARGHWLRLWWVTIELLVEALQPTTCLARQAAHRPETWWVCQLLEQHAACSTGASLHGRPFSSRQFPHLKCDQSGLVSSLCICAVSQEFARLQLRASPGQIIIKSSTHKLSECEGFALLDVFWPTPTRVGCSNAQPWPGSSSSPQKVILGKPEAKKALGEAKDMHFNRLHRFAVQAGSST